MTAEDITFGVEIEATIPTGTLQVGYHGHGTPIPQLPGWKADGDPSIRPGSGHAACEFVSPVFKGSEGLKQCLQDLQTIRGLGAKVNPTCGLHVHVGIDKGDAALIAKLTTLVANFEKAIYASTGTRKRETGRWCNGLARYGNVDMAQERNRMSRYHVANFATGAKPTVEFRAFAATLNSVKLTGAVMMCVGLVERAIRAAKPTKWVAKVPVATSPIHRGGEGQTAVNRLFYQLGWTKGHQPHVHGDLKGDGIPPMAKVKEEIVRLAKKYDTVPATPAAAAVTTRFPLGARVRYVGPGQAYAGQEAVIAHRQPRCNPVIQFADGQRFRVTFAQIVAI